MPRINPVDPESSDAKTAATLQAVEKKLGILPNIFTTFAQSPAALNSYVRLGESLAGGRLTARQRERIALAVAQENACQYCLSAHAAIGQGAGLSRDDIARARSGLPGGPSGPKTASCSYRPNTMAGYFSVRR
jgi:AhpD family alkylhydroperoxidase